VSRRQPAPLGRRRGEDAPFLILSGLSGAGKSHALRALEDLGYYCVDNLPVPLIPAFADLTLTGQREARRAAVVVDVREGRSLQPFPQVFRHLMRRHKGRIRLVFLEASDAALIRRFSETRRPHPLGAGSVRQAVARERRLLQPLRQLANLVVDTSGLTVHDLRRRVLQVMGGTMAVAPLMVSVTSFGFRRGVPPEADLVFDVRFLPNPHFVPRLRPWSGRHASVARFVLRSAAARRFLALTHALLVFLIPQYVQEGKAYLTIAVGCTGGRHRSVTLAETIGRRLRRMKGIAVRVHHRDVAEH
jgi:UPF0042 nucleotide-binding protein